MFGERTRFITFEPLEKAVEHGFRLNGERLEMLVEEAFGRQVAGLAVAEFAGKLVRMCLHRFIGELLKRLSEFTVFQFRGQLREGGNRRCCLFHLTRFGRLAP